MAGKLTIGGASGFWGETAQSVPQLLRHEGLDVLVFDYLAEITMSILARAKAKDETAGYARDFVTDAMAPNLNDIAKRNIKVLSNAGGLNPAACARALRTEITRLGLDLKVATVEGDDLVPLCDRYRDKREMFSNRAFPDADKITSMNAYFGAGTIIGALDAGADIVITGRCVDSALTLAATAHHFGWGMDDFDRLAAGSLAGHLLECGPQATGGNFTDWQEAGDLAAIGYPVIEIAGDGAITITKPAGTGGCVTPASVAEQMLYEIGDPRAYVLPDVTCDFSEVTLEQEDETRVRITGAKGQSPTGQLKVSLTHMNGYRAGHVFFFNGRGARRKAETYANMGLARARAKMAQSGAPDFSDVCVETFGGVAGPDGYEEITLKTAVRHEDARAVGLFLKETMGAALATPPGMHMFTGGGRPRPSPVVELFSFLVPAEDVQLSVTLEGASVPFEAPPPLPSQAHATPAPEPEIATTTGPHTTVPLERLAWARSGDKGDKANIGVIARDPEFMPWIWQALTPEKVADVFGSLIQGPVERFYLPGTHSMNLLLHAALGGGGVASLRNDPQAKSFAQVLLNTPVPIPSDRLPHDMKGAPDAL